MDAIRVNGEISCLPDVWVYGMQVTDRHSGLVVYNGPYPPNPVVYMMFRGIFDEPEHYTYVVFPVGNSVRCN